MRKPKLFTAGVLCLAAIIALRVQAAASEWQTIDDCRLIENESNDGDSFHVDADGEERIFRLYFVDTPEAEEGGRVAERITEQAETFGITEEESIQLGKKAAAFTSAVLSRPFAVLTRGQNAMGASQLKREYAFVTTADGEDLGEILVSRGLARSYGKDATTPDSKAGDLRDRYDALEAKARREKVGAWGDGASVPTMALPEGSKPSNETASPAGSVAVALFAPATPGSKPLASFGDITIGTTEREFVRAHPRAERGEDWSDGTQTLHIYVLQPPESLDADKVTFIFADGRLGQIDHFYGKKRLEERGGWQKDYESLSEMFGHAGKPYAVDPQLSPKTEKIFNWKCEPTGETASLDLYADGSSQVTFCMWEDNDAEGSTHGGSRDASTSENTLKPNTDRDANRLLLWPKQVKNSVAAEPQQVTTHDEGKPVSFGNQTEILYQRKRDELSATIFLRAPVDTLAKVYDYKTGKVEAIVWLLGSKVWNRNTHCFLKVPAGLYKFVYAQQVHETADGEFYAGYYGKLREPVEVRYDPPASVDLSINDTEYPNVKSSAKEFGSFRPPH